MALLRTFTGKATLVAGDKRYDNVQYRLDVWGDARRIHGTGSFKPTDPVMMREVFMLTNAVLEMSHGPVEIVVTKGTYGSTINATEFVTSGPIPGISSP